MFTGIITDLGSVKGLEKRPGGEVRFEIATTYKAEAIPLGASIAHNGVCLTLVETGPGWFAVFASLETLDKTTLGGWQVGSPVNLERALKVGDELGGHIVSGHVDGVGTVVSIEPEGESLRFTFEVPESIEKFIAPKGSVAIDGVSLTVNEVNGRLFGVNIIPHTCKVTTFGQYKPGDRVNLEIDMLARYVARLLDKD
ncbi:MAG: riboflavin synthase [Alphaproteobacteria bacterium]|nr:riboflavin synthase [Alphaproteobacteria bacterium]